MAGPGQCIGDARRSLSSHCACRSILVVGLQLGCLNHALLTVDAIQNAPASSGPAGSPTALCRTWRRARREPGIFCMNACRGRVSGYCPIRPAGLRPEDGGPTFSISTRLFQT